MQVEVEAITTFEHDRTRRRFSRFSVSEQTADSLAKKGLVVRVKKNTTATPAPALSVSQAAPASRPATLKKSATGGSKKAPEKSAG